MVLFALPAQADLLLTEAEIAAALRHGPWPVEFLPDPSNQVSGNPAAIGLGEQLFSDPILSVDGAMSCATCHNPETGFSDRLPRAKGREVLDRNTLSLFNQRFNRWYGWSGDTDNLWAQSLTPIFNPPEMAHSEASLVDAIRRSGYVSEYEALFGSIDAHDDRLLAVNVAKTLAAFQEIWVTGQTPFDVFRDALAIKDYETAALYPKAAQRGFQIFAGKGNCVFCHSGPLFSNGEFHDAGVPYFIEFGRVDEGRHGGITALLASPFTLAGDYNDDPSKEGAWAVNGVARQHSDFGTFRVPGLRSLSRTAPYMHDGSRVTLHDVIDHYNDIDMERLHTDGEAILRPLNLSQNEIDDLVAFLRSLDD